MRNYSNVSVCRRPPYAFLRYTAHGRSWPACSPTDDRLCSTEADIRPRKYGSTNSSVPLVQLRESESAQEADRIDVNVLAGDKAVDEGDHVDALP